MNKNTLVPAGLYCYNRVRQKTATTWERALGKGKNIC